MRLWHYKLIPHLPRQQLLGQHRECCALRGKGWGRKHSTVDYVFEHSYRYLYDYHVEIMLEMIRRGYHVNEKWGFFKYRGKSIGYVTWEELPGVRFTITDLLSNSYYPEHNDKYLRECLNNLKGKGIIIKRSCFEQKTRRVFK